MSRYDERAETFRALDAVRTDACRLEQLDLNKERIVIISDVHKGDKTDCDDFRKNEYIYCHALRHYQQKKFRLILNGDIEESWESPTDSISKAYSAYAFQIEKTYNQKPGSYFRVTGNHDPSLNDSKAVESFLNPLVGQIQVHQGMLINNQILIVHGHQGDRQSDKTSRRSRWFVRHVWAPLQRRHLTWTILPIIRLLRIECENRAAENVRVRQARDQYLYEWAKKNRLLLIAGHTHRAMFCSSSKADNLQEFVQGLEAAEELDFNDKDYFLKKASFAYLTNQLENSQDDLKQTAPDEAGKPTPCYFNAGSCVFTNGITAIELDRGEIKLVKWEVTDTVFEKQSGFTRRPDYFISIERKLYQKGSLADILAEIQSDPA